MMPPDRRSENQRLWTKKSERGERVRGRERERSEEKENINRKEDQSKEEET